MLNIKNLLKESTKESRRKDLLSKIDSDTSGRIDKKLQKQIAKEHPSLEDIEQHHRDIDSLREDINTSDYRISDTGGKVRAHKVTFTSKVDSKSVNPPDGTQAKTGDIPPILPKKVKPVTESLADEEHHIYDKKEKKFISSHPNKQKAYHELIDTHKLNPSLTVLHPSEFHIYKAKKDDIEPKK